jgi:hypothetical protein
MPLIFVTPDGTFGDLRTIRAVDAEGLDIERMSDNEIAQYAELHGVPVVPQKPLNA